MAFEIFTRKIVRSGAPGVTASKLGRMAINKRATSFFEKNAVEYVLVLWDADTKKIAIRPIAKRDPRAYRLKYGEKGNGAGFSAKTFFDHIGLDFSESRPMPAHWDDDQDMLVIDVPAEHLRNTPTQPSLTAMGTTATIPRKRINATQ